MRIRSILCGATLLSAVMLALAGCSAKPVEFDLEVSVTLDGRPVSGAAVVVDGASEGTSDAKGRFRKTLAKVPEKKITLVVRKEDGKFRSKAWEQDFSIKSRKENEPKEKQAFTAQLQRYVTIAVTAEGQPVAGAEVSVDNKAIGQTPANGEIEYVFSAWPKRGLRVSAKKEGFGETSFAYTGESGDRVAAALYKDAVIRVEALEDDDGRVKPVKGASVFVGQRRAGSTDGSGVVTYRHKGTFGERAQVRITSGAHLPSSYTRTVMLGGQHKIHQYFYPAVARQPRTAVLSFVGNTAGEDIGDVVRKIEAGFVEELFGSKTFRPVPTTTARNLIKRAKISLEKLKTAGWRNTELADQVDVLVFGSVSRAEEDSYVVEVSFYRKDGKLVMTQAAIAGSSGSWRVGRAVSEIVSNALAAYPFTGTVTGVDADGYKINLGKSQFSIGGDDVFVLQSAKRDENGRITSRVDSGTLKVRRRRDDHTILQQENLRGTPRVGDSVVRLDTSTRADGSDRVVIAVKGGSGTEATPLAGANIYVDQHWVGTTDRKGEATVPVRVGRKHKLLVYRHGYEQATKSIEPGKRGERYAFALKSFSSQFTVESEPSSAAVSLDDTRIGSTPLTKPYAVTLGFHSVRVDAGGDYRPWEEVLQFSKKEESRTGADKVILYKDYLRLGERAENGGNVDEAIRLYAAGAKEHPDYAELHNHLGQVYFDAKRDVDRAIAEFELVQDIPEVQDLVYKQYAVVYTNLGKAYYAKGEAIFRANPNDAMKYFGKAIKALERARENTRFFPNERHDEAVHDTYYYRALSYHNLFNATKREALLGNVESAWNEYFDFFPAGLRDKPEYVQLRESAEKLSHQVLGR